MSRRHSRIGIEPLSRQRRIHLASIPNIENRRECVREVEDQQRANKTRDAVEIRDGGRDDERDDPVDGAESIPKQLPLLARDFRPSEDLLADLDIYGLHADIEVQQTSHERGDQAQDVVNLLETERLDGVSDVGDGVLAIVSVHEGAEEDVHDADEGLRA
jgi:hypothetical protein